MSFTWKIENESIVLYDKATGQRLIHSVKLGEKNLSFRYWDYLAWPIYKMKIRNVLLLGLGGGTVLELLKRWGYLPNFLGVEIDKGMTEAIHKHGWLNYPNLHIVNQDACQFVEETDRQFDAVIVDLYDHNGFVQEMYKLPKLQKLIKLLNPGGFLAIHCFDPSIKYIVLNLSFGEPIPSVSYTVAKQLKSQKMNVSIIPYWSSSLVLARYKYYDVIPLQMYLKQENEPIEVEWLTKFLTFRLKHICDLECDLTLIDNDYSYTVLGEIDKKYLQQLASSAPGDLGEKILKGLGMSKTERPKIMSTVCEKISNKTIPLSEPTVIGLLLLMDLLKFKNNHTHSEIKTIIKKISEQREKSLNPAMVYMESFAYAWAGYWNQAIMTLSSLCYNKTRLKNRKTLEVEL